MHSEVFTQLKLIDKKWTCENTYRTSVVSCQEFWESCPWPQNRITKEQLDVICPGKNVRLHFNLCCDKTKANADSEGILTISLLENNWQFSHFSASFKWKRNAKFRDIKQAYFSFSQAHSFAHEPAQKWPFCCHFVWENLIKQAYLKARVCLLWLLTCTVTSLVDHQTLVAWWLVN